MFGGVGVRSEMITLENTRSRSIRVRPVAAKLFRIVYNWNLDTRLGVIESVITEVAYEAV